VLVSVPLIAVLGFFGTILYVYSRTPIPVAPNGAQTTFLYDDHGHLITDQADD